MHYFVVAIFACISCLSSPDSVSPLPDAATVILDDGAVAVVTDDGAIVTYDAAPPAPDAANKGINEECERGECAPGLDCIGMRCYELCETTADCSVGNCEGESSGGIGFCVPF